MSKKQKPSERRPVGLEARAETERLYSRPDLDRITGLVPMRDARRRPRLASRVVGIATLYVIESSHEGKAPPSENREQIKRVRKTARDLIEAVDALDDETRQMLHQAADLVTGSDYLEKLRDTFGGSVGRMRLNEAMDAVKPLAGWCQYAMGELQPGQPGSHGNMPILRAVARLRDAWTEATGEEPTLTVNREKKTSGTFLKFVGKALKPVASDANFEHACRIALYGGN